MDLYLLGTAGYHPNETRHTACLMIPEAGIIFDAGSAFFRVRELIQTRDLHIFLSHCHLDHCIGLTFYLDVFHQRDVDNVFVYGQSEKLAAIREHLFSQLLFPVQPDFRWIELNGDSSIDVAPNAKLRVFPLVHPGGSLGFRVDWPDHSMAYVTDTTAKASADYLAKIRGVDLLVHECHFPDGYESMAEKTGHSCLTPVAEISRDAEVGMTVITHVNPLSEKEAMDLDASRLIFENMLIGEDNMVIKLQQDD